MSKIKATHQGHCQCCGSLQKLPGGILSLHGYTVEHGWFSGVCQGAGHQPFEVSCDLVEKFIESAKAHLAYLEATKAKWLLPATEAKAWVQKYEAPKYKVKGGYFWELVEIKHEWKAFSSGGGGYDKYFYDVPEKSSFNAGVIELGYGEDKPKTLLEVCTWLNAKYAATFDAKIAGIKQYIAWQTKRVAEWKPEPLIEIK